MKAKKNYRQELETFLCQTLKIPESRPHVKQPDNTVVDAGVPAKKPKFSFEEQVTNNINLSLLSDVCNLQDCKRDLEHQLRQQAVALQHAKHQENKGGQCTKRKGHKLLDRRRASEKLQRKTQQAKRWRDLYQKRREQDRSMETLQATVVKLNDEKRNLRSLLKREKQRGEQKEKKLRKEIQDEIQLKIQANESLLDEIRKQHHQYNAEIFQLKQKILELEVQNTQLHDQLHEDMGKEQPAESTYIRTKEDKKTYNEKLRQCVYFCLSKEVPVASVSSILQFIVETLTDKTCENVPSMQTVCRMAKEMGTLSDIQTYEKIESSPSDLTLCFDGTTKKDHHLNEVHLSSSSQPQGTILLGLGDLPGGKAVDYHNNIVQGFEDLAETASMYTQRPQEEILNSLTSSISGVVTDRCVVNHAVVKQLEDSWKHQLVEMKCNVHPLDGVAKSANTALKKFDEDQGFKG